MPIDKNKTPLEDEKEKKSETIIEASTSAKAKPDAKVKPVKRKRGRPKKVVNEAEPFDAEKSKMQGVMFVEMMKEYHVKNGIEPLPDYITQPWISSIPMIEQKYQSSVSRWMPELMFCIPPAYALIYTMNALKEKKAVKKGDKNAGKNKQD